MWYVVSFFFLLFFFLKITNSYWSVNESKKQMRTHTAPIAILDGCWEGENASVSLSKKDRLSLLLSCFIILVISSPWKKPLQGLFSVITAAKLAAILPALLKRQEKVLAISTPDSHTKAVEAFIGSLISPIIKWSMGEKVAWMRVMKMKKVLTCVSSWLEECHQSTSLLSKSLSCITITFWINKEGQMWQVESNVYLIYL